MQIPSDPYGTANDAQQEGHIISQERSDSLFSKSWLKWSLFAGFGIIMLGGTAAVVVTIKNTTDTFTKAADKQQTNINQVLDEINGTAPASSFGLVAQVQAEENNPFDEQNQYQNPFTSSSNPFDQVDP